MTELAVPYDAEAEEQVAGAAVATVHGYAYAAAAGVTPGDFYRPALARLFAACADLTNVRDHDERIAEAARLAEVDESEVRWLVDVRSCMFGVCGTHAGRAIETARRRRAMQAAAEAYNALGTGVPLDDVRSLLVEVAS